jgi:F-type H+-transporting ATPase subunit delta
MQDLLAKRYARALFSVGLEDGFYKGYGQELSEFWASLKQAGAMGEVLSSLAYPPEVRGRALEAVLAAAKLAPLVQNFLRLLHDRGRFGLLGAITEAYRFLVDEKEGLLRGSLVSAFPLEDRQLAALKSALGTFIGRKVELTVTLDSFLIGGVVAKLGDLVVDGSLRTKLNKMSQSLGVI